MEIHSRFAQSERLPQEDDTVFKKLGYFFPVFRATFGIGRF